jgi:hypothetical protein
MTLDILDSNPDDERKMPPHKRERETVLALQDGLRQCPTCGIWFAPIPPVRRSTAVYCERSCREIARQRRGARSGIPAISPPQNHTRAPDVPETTRTGTRPAPPRVRGDASDVSPRTSR